MSSNNTLYIAAAGSRKTTRIVEQALAVTSGRVLITTYTTENLEQIRKRILEARGCIPSNITIQSWLSFLLIHGARPFQNVILGRRIRSIDYNEPNRYNSRANPERYYLDRGDNIYNRHLSDFVLRCNSATSGSVIKRLEGIFEYIFVDEVQDMSGYDLDLLQLLFESRITLVGVGDPRQWIYSTNNSSRHKKYRGSEISKWFDHMKSSGLCELIHHNECYRCNQVICDFADALYPSFVPTVSKYTDLTGHDGVFTLRSSDLGNYMMRFAPTILCYDKNAETYGHSALNFGQAKGMTYERVVICPTGPIRAFLEGGDAQALKDISRAKLYVAITRAKSSVAFIYDGRKNVVIPEFISDVE